MVKYVDVNNIIRLISKIGLDEVLLGLVDYIEEDFRRWPDFDKGPRLASHSAEGVIELMPTSDGTLYGFKYVNGHPRNVLRGLQTVSAFGVLADVSTGYPCLLSEMTITTALRTAAMSALAAKYLTRKNSTTMAIIGLGAQSEFQALAFRALLGIKRLRVYDIDPAVTQKFITNMAPYDLEIAVTTAATDAVIGADIITTITADKLNATILSDNMVGAGVHINAVGGDCPGKTELQPDILLRADVFVELPEQTRIEGEIQQLSPDFPVKELWRVFTGELKGRISEDQITIFDSVGFAIEDFSALRYLHDQVLDTDFYTNLDLVASPDDPRDLFGLLGMSKTTSVRQLATEGIS